MYAPRETKTVEPVKKNMSAVGVYLLRVVGVRFEEREGGGLRWNGIGRYIPIMRQEVQSKS